MEQTTTPISVRKLLDDLAARLDLTIAAGKSGIDRPIEAPFVQRPGLALSGYLRMLETGRIQVFGQNEIAYLEFLPAEARAGALEHFIKVNPPCVVVTRGRTPPAELVHHAERSGVPLLLCPLPSAVFIEQIHEYLFNRLAPIRTIHGVLMDILGVGILIMGKSGIGKSECALDLVLRGHRLVADDVVEVYRRPPATVIGRGADLIRYHMEIRGLGVISIKDLFGISAIRDHKVIDLVACLEEWDEDESYDRLGTEKLTHEILGVQMPKIIVPVKPGRPMAAIIEVAARDRLLHFHGIRPAHDLAKRLEERIREKAPDSQEPATGPQTPGKGAA